MLKLQLHDNGKHNNFAPLSLTRAIGNIRIGILTNDERWKALVSDVEIGYNTEDYLSSKFAKNGGVDVNACAIPNQDLVEAVKQLKPGQGLLDENNNWLAGDMNSTDMITYSGEEVVIINNRWEIYQKNDLVLKADFELLTKGKVSNQLSSTNTIIGDPNLIFLEDGASVEAAILNAMNGPIYVGKDAEIMEGSIVRGPVALCEHAALKMGAKVYGATTLGPHCKVGGEINNVVFQAYSNKGHDGFLGNSVIGEWCNLGADTNSSNLKNNYGTVKTYDYASKSLIQTDVQFMGLMMGDHSKCGINTMFNTATVVGVSSNVFGGDFPPKYIPSFSWGVDGTNYNFDKAMESANNMMERRGKQLSTDEIAILNHISDTE